MVRNAAYDDAWLGLGDTNLIETTSSFINRTNEDNENPAMQLLKYFRDPRYLYFTCKHLLGITLLPIQVAILQELWYRTFPMLLGSRGLGKTFLLALYAVLRCILFPGTKIIVAGAGFRQSKLISEYMETIWYNAPIVQNIFGGKPNGPSHDVDRHTMRFGDSWSIAIPIGTGEKIRGLRANIVIVDEFDAVNPEIYEIVLQGFAAVASSPIDNVILQSKRQALIDAGVWKEEYTGLYEPEFSNQAIISGTAGYSFKHFAKYWKRYKGIVESGGDYHKLLDVFEGRELPENFDWKDYSVIRIPYELVPKGFLDEKTIARAKATVHVGVYGMEYGCCFMGDSTGFFKRSLIESCVTSETAPINLLSGPVYFDALLRGSSVLSYIIAVDPSIGSASDLETDNFSLVVLELHEDHSRIVYMWSTNRKMFKQRLKEYKKSNLDIEQDYFAYCARKIRDTMIIFPCIRIGMDAQGGGIAIEEALHDPDKLQKGETLIWPAIDPDKEKDTDDEPGLHILELIQFAKADWTSEANNGLRKDMEDKVLLFPRLDAVTMGLAMENDKIAVKAGNKARMYDSLEDCVLEIEELKNELCTIVMSQTLSGRDRWDTPEVKLMDGRKGRMRKDRYSSLVIGNMLARQHLRTPPPLPYHDIGCVTHKVKKGKREGPMYHGPEWFTNNIGDVCVGIDKR